MENARSIQYLITAVYRFYKTEPVLLIDEYDQPVLCSYENGFREELGDFFAAMFGTAVKGNEYVTQVLLTGIQRIAKESIFSKLNNLQVYSVIREDYASCFGLTEDETRQLLRYYGLELTDKVKNKYDGYRLRGLEIYNPWSILNYMKHEELGDYWINTSTNYLIRQALDSAGPHFRKDFDRLIEEGEVKASVNLETSFMELQDTQSLWGLLVNSGYVTVTGIEKGGFLKLRIPNEEVKSEFQKIVAEQANISPDSLRSMFQYLQDGDMEHFLSVYQEIVLSCTSYHDARENAYHMLFLGMCISLRGMYKIKSNLEAGEGRSDILMESLDQKRCYIIIEFKQGEDVEKKKTEALEQIISKQYFADLRGKILCMGIAHNKKECQIAWKYVER